MYHSKQSTNDIGRVGTRYGKNHGQLLLLLLWYITSTAVVSWVWCGRYHVSSAADRSCSSYRQQYLSVEKERSASDVPGDQQLDPVYPKL